ncbi:MAG: efflux RND transporter periplasmic adaptor subunit [Gammaproteobacteria bacterium]|nr:efflux RND transporter periplasmic adaptor subunit [Gammaproteobacteria bacterium]
MTAPVHQIGTPTSGTRIRDTAAQDIVKEKQSGWRRWSPLILIGMVLLALVVFVTQSNWWRAQGAVNAKSLRLATVERSTFSREISAPGVIVAAVSPSVYAPSTGTVTLHVNAGDLVNAGDTIATITSPELSNQLAQETATLNSLQTNLQRRSIEHKQQALRSQQLVDIARMNQTTAARELRRAEAAWEIQVISRQDLEKAQDDVERAAVEFSHSKSAAALEKESLEFELQTLRLERDRQALLVDNLQRQVADLNVVAPVSGMVGTIAVAQKEAVGGNQALMSIVDLSAFEIEASIAESYASRLLPGTPVTISYGNQEHAGMLHTISPEVTNNSVTGRIRFAGTPPTGLRQNQRVTTTFELESVKDALTVPRGAFIDSGGGRITYVVENGMAYRRAIEIGASSSGRIEITSGVKEGDTVVVSSLEPFRGAEQVLVSP